MSDIKEIMDEIESHVVDINLKFNYEFGSEFENKLSPNQQLTLLLIGRKGVKYVKDLAQIMNLSPSAISQMVTKMEQMRLVTREIDQTNRRSTLLRLGSEGEQLLADLQEKRSAITTKYLAKIDKKRLLEIRDTLKQLNDIILETQKEDSK
ncbi:MarR family transcriptional regulator [Salipaludibacillus sp. LMS25]|jgi:DNA-binding MarR family transcriptional regulator|uniref:MarR family winged helix-turn-helix transcriptional regulator n=1 Tax=Salipaludibacillus sp. LMS25 TaxID=2924031 RepID=UPI0020D16310|nr:MarR family transcriptional regulator [Salipaludibacillus sp. LMS25]UTR15430.1 MarR family transcriptional regulator [Salipaludibacillus sp. LMS25]